MPVHDRVPAAARDQPAVDRPGGYARDEFEWLNAYHLRVWTEIAPFLSGEAKAWLEQATAPFDEWHHPTARREA